MTYTIAQALDDKRLFEPWFRGDSWSTWRSVLKASFGLKLTKSERDRFQAVAEREPPTGRVRELWAICGRRAGKDSVASVIAAHAAAFFDGSKYLRPGERALVLCLATDRDQAKIVLNYVKAFFELPMLKPMVQRETQSGLELTNNVDIAVATNSFRAVRGRAILCAILDECAFYRDETSATPDREVYNAITPGLMTIPGSMLIGISSPYRKNGLLFERWRKHYGKDGDVLVIQAASIAMNPTLDQRLIDRALEEDRAAAGAEWLAEWRSDIESFVSPEIVQAAIDPFVYERPPISGVQYIGFTDPSGGSSDSMTLCIAHIENRVITVDAIREARSPFSPDAVVREHADLLKRYHVEAVVGDRYGGEWPREKFKEYGIGYRVAPKNRSELYLALLPQLNSKCVALLDNKRLVSQLCGLERRASRGGRDVVDHAPGGHDDVANAVAGAIVIALEAAGQELPAVSPIIIDKNGQEITAPTTNQTGRPPSHWLKLGQKQEAWMPFVGRGRWGI
jgi:hypothetical protein